MPNTLTPDEISVLEGEFLRNKYPQKERENMDESDFCGPDKSFPVKDAEDVIHAAQRLGEAKGEQASIKKCVIGKAHAHGWPLPKTWEEDGKEEKADVPDILRTMPSELQFYMPILRVDREKREVIARATSEALDSYSTIFGYEASKEIGRAHV